MLNPNVKCHLADFVVQALFFLLQITEFLVSSPVLLTWRALFPHPQVGVVGRSSNHSPTSSGLKPSSPKTTTFDMPSLLLVFSPLDRIIIDQISIASLLFLALLTSSLICKPAFSVICQSTNPTPDVNQIHPMPPATGEVIDYEDYQELS